ncbi:hypothetical protein [Nitrincola lacisaponensis]|uniref:hypothetical protein n=1 Tax=Nitrincola lacisaponensis TaxID=267850 RepID=UPI000564DDEA|nr:hypothetical protein [Nitrincola lacisaponensis]
MTTGLENGIIVHLFKHSYASFNKAMKDAGIEYYGLAALSFKPQASGFTEFVQAFSESMPWNSLAKVIVAWIDARASREVIITTRDSKVVHMKGYGIKEVERLLNNTKSITVVDTDPENET